MCQYFSKTEDQSSQTTKQEAKEAFENNMPHHDTMKTIAKDYLRNQECSVQETVNHILPESKLRRIFLAIYIVNTNFPEERVQVLLSEKELSKLPDDNPNILKKSNIDYYIERTSATFCNGKYRFFKKIQIFVMHNSHITQFKRNQVRPVNISQANFMII